MPGERSCLWQNRPRQYHHDAEKRADYCCGVIFQSQQHRNIPRQAAQDDTCRQFVLSASDGQEPEKCGNLAITAAPTIHCHVRAVFIVKNAVFLQVKSRRKHPKNAPLRNRGTERVLHENRAYQAGKITTDIGLTRRPLIHIRTHNTRLGKASACIQPPLSGDLPAD